VHEFFKGYKTFNCCSFVNKVNFKSIDLYACLSSKVCHIIPMPLLAVKMKFYVKNHIYEQCVFLKKLKDKMPYQGVS